jgi:hypothetical protein
MIKKSTTGIEVIIKTTFFTFFDFIIPNRLRSKLRIIKKIEIEEIIINTKNIYFCIQVIIPIIVISGIAVL